VACAVPAGAVGRAAGCGVVKPFYYCSGGWSKQLPGRVLRPPSGWWSEASCIKLVAGRRSVGSAGRKVHEGTTPVDCATDTQPQGPIEAPVDLRAAEASFGRNTRGGAREAIQDCLSRVGLLHHMAMILTRALIERQCISCRERSLRTRTNRVAPGARGRKACVQSRGGQHAVARWSARDRAVVSTRHLSLERVPPLGRRRRPSVRRSPEALSGRSLATPALLKRAGCRAVPCAAGTLAAMAWLKGGSSLTAPVRDSSRLMIFSRSLSLKGGCALVGPASEFNWGRGERGGRIFQKCQPLQPLQSQKSTSSCLPFWTGFQSEIKHLNQNSLPS